MMSPLFLFVTDILDLLSYSMFSVNVVERDGDTWWYSRVRRKEGKVLTFKNGNWDSNQNPIWFVRFVKFTAFQKLNTDSRMLALGCSGDYPPSQRLGSASAKVELICHVMLYCVLLRPILMDALCISSGCERQRGKVRVSFTTENRRLHEKCLHDHLCSLQLVKQIRQKYYKHSEVHSPGRTTVLQWDGSWKPGTFPCVCMGFLRLQRHTEWVCLVSLPFCLS